MTGIALAVLAHPDDAEILCAGTLIRLVVEHRWKVAIATMTAGDCGSAEHTSEQIADIRLAEAKAAAQLIGAEYQCLGERDLEVHFRPELVRKTTQLIREIRPEIVITHYPNDYHLDHEETSRAVRAAAFAAPVPLYHPRSQAIPHVPHLYYCDPVEAKDALGQPVYAPTMIDITHTIDRKEQMLACHASQREWLKRHHGVDQYLMAMRNWSSLRGAAAAFAFAEGFRQHRGHGFPQNDVLAELLSP